jgi:hypothetical protein
MKTLSFNAKGLNNLTSIEKALRQVFRNLGIELIADPRGALAPVVSYDSLARLHSSLETLGQNAGEVLSDLTGYGENPWILDLVFHTKSGSDLVVQLIAGSHNELIATIADRLPDALGPIEQEPASEPPVPSDQLDEEEKRLVERQRNLLEQGGQLEAADQIGQMYG